MHDGRQVQLVSEDAHVVEVVVVGVLGDAVVLLSLLVHGVHEKLEEI